MSPRLVLALLAATLAPACGLRVEEPPQGTPTYTLPDVVAVSDDVPAAERVRLPRLARDSAQRQARKLTVRVRNVSCLGVSTGSGFAIAPDILVTNRHVLAGGHQLEVSTWNGRTLPISNATVGVIGDIGIAVVDGKLPLIGRFGPPPRPDALVTAVGYPLGGPLTLSQGSVIDRVDGESLGIPGAVTRLTTLIQPGNSGGPLLDRKGRIAAIVYAIETRTGFGLAIPVDTFRRLVRIGGFEDVPACGSE